MWDKKSIDHARLHAIFTDHIKKVSSSFFDSRGNIDKKKTRIFPIWTPNQHIKTFIFAGNQLFDRKSF